MIFVGVGANLMCPGFTTSRATCGGALGSLETSGLPVVQRSPWYESAPVPTSDQPWFVNAVAEVSWDGTPRQLIDTLLEIESDFGRMRAIRNAPRVLDLDLIAFGEFVSDATARAENRAVVPHPRMHERAFVLLPMRDIAPDWRHPANGKTLDEMIEALPPDQEIRRMEDARGRYGTEWEGDSEDTPSR